MANLSTIMSAYPVRDRILNLICPADVYRLHTAMRIKISKEDKERYGNVFRSVIPDRDALSHLLKNGYKLTLLSNDMNVLMDTSSHTLLNPTVVDRAFAILLATKNERFSDIAYKGLDIGAFLNSRTYSNMHTDKIESAYEPGWRVVTVSGPGLTISLMIPRADGSTLAPLFLYSQMFEKVFTNRHWNASGPLVSYKHLTKDGCSITNVSRNSEGDLMTFEEACTNLFSVQSMTTSRSWLKYGAKHVLYRFNE